MISVFRQNEGLRTLAVEGKTILYKIHFFNPEGIMYSTHSGYFDVGYQDIIKWNLPVDEIKRKQKLDFSSKSPFIYKDNNDRTNNSWDAKYSLYVPADMVGLKYLGDFVFYDGDEETSYVKKFSVKFSARLSSDSEVVDREFELKTSIIKTVKKDFGKLVEDTLNDLKVQGIDIQHYQLVNLLKKYKLEKIV